jgi:hypothetical protein
VLSLLPVAEKFKQPLYCLSAANLGGNIATIKTRLNEALTRCAAFNAVLLIDEADVFLEAWVTFSLEKNELVSSESFLHNAFNGTS